MYNGPPQPNKLSSWNEHDHLLKSILYVNSTFFSDRDGYTSNVSGWKITYDMVYQSTDTGYRVAIILAEYQFPYSPNFFQSVQTFSVSKNWSTIQQEMANYPSSEGWEQVELEFKLKHYISSDNPYRKIPPFKYRIQIGPLFFYGTLSVLGDYTTMGSIPTFTFYNTDNPLQPNTAALNNQVGIVLYNL